VYWLREKGSDDPVHQQERPDHGDAAPVRGAVHRRDRRDLQDKPQVGNGAWMMLIAEAHIPSFLTVSFETLAFNDPYEQVPEPGGQWSRRPTSGSTRPWRSPPPSARCSKNEPARKEIRRRARELTMKEANYGDA